MKPLAATPTDPAASARLLLAQQVQLHSKNAPWASSSVLMAALLFVGVQWHAVPHGPLLAWLAAMVVVMLWRFGLCLWQRHSMLPQPADAVWLRLYRVNFLAHGLVWAAASALPMPGHDPFPLVLVMLLAGVVASNFILNAFDLAAALLLGVPALGGLVLRLLDATDAVQQMMGLAALLAMGLFSLTGRRAHRLVHENAVLRQAQARQNQLLDLLIDNTGEGFWFIDDQAITTDANPAMCQMLGRPREAVLGRSLYAFVDADNRAIIEREIARRADGNRAGGYEVALQRPDGSAVHCFVHTTQIVDAQGQHLGAVGLWTDISDRKRAERALQDTSEALRQKTQALEDTLGSISQGISYYDGQGRLRVHNQRMLELLGLPASLFGPEVLHRDVLNYQLSQGEGMLMEREFFDASGQPQSLPASLTAMPDVYVRRTRAGLLVEARTRRLPDGGMVRTFSDVTAHIQAQQALAAREREQRDLLDAFPGFIVVTDHNYRYTYVNQRFADLLGRTREQIVGQLGPEVLGDARFAQVRSTLERVRPGEPVNTESEYPATAWRPRMFIQVTHAVTEDPTSGQRRVYAFAIDISARKAAEAALVATRDEAERANRAKSQFLSSMSHELRTPLNAILGFGHLLATDSAHPLAPRQQAQMAEILHGAGHLLQLINEILDMAVVESGSLPVRLQPVALAPVLAEALALLQPLAHSHGIGLPAVSDTLVADACVLADPVRLKQVLLNLLGNAIKYNQPQGQVRVLCQAMDGTGGAPGSAGWRITIQDSGPGLDAAQQARLFSAFERLDAGQRGVEGTGLGLALSRGLVRAMGGEVGVHSSPGEGSSFWLQLPAAAAAPR